MRREDVLALAIGGIEQLLRDPAIAEVDPQARAYLKEGLSFRARPENCIDARGCLFSAVVLLKRSGKVNLELATEALDESYPPQSIFNEEVDRRRAEW